MTSINKEYYAVLKKISEMRGKVYNKGKKEAPDYK
jgi:hypothetical protein